MIILDRHHYRGLLLFGLALVLGLGIFGYLTAELWSPDSPAHLIKEGRERFFFVSLLGAGIFIAYGLFLSRRAASNLKKLDRLFSQGLTARENIDLWEQQLGPLGKRFILYNQEILRIGTLKTQKIQGLSSLVQILINNSTEPFLIVDIRGIVLYATPALYGKLKKASSEILQTPLSRHLSDYKPLEMAAEMQRSQSSREIILNQQNYTVHPVYDGSRQCAYLLLTWGGKAFSLPEPEIMSPGAARLPKKEGGFVASLSRLFSRKQS